MELIDKVANPLELKEACEKSFIVEEKNETFDGVASVVIENKTNVVAGDKLRKIQNETLINTREYLAKTFGPMGSNTKIITGNDYKSVAASYSKDGLKVLSSIINSGVIESSIVNELVDITRHVEHEVGDGTTSTVILSSLIFTKLMQIQKNYNIPPYELIRKFKNTVAEIQEYIQNQGRPCTLDDIYNITMISTNGNTEVAENIKRIYEENGMDVDLSVGISPNSQTMTKTYDGLIISEGYSDAAYINNRAENTCTIRNARVYHFSDPVDTPGMVSWLESILNHNIYEPIQNDEDPIPTVITCPRISQDLKPTLKKLVQVLHNFSTSDLDYMKPPILIITNVVASDELIMDDIANLCGCKSISKYIDPNMLKRDQEAGLAPTVENVFEFYGECEEVVSNEKKTKFINPKHMKHYDADGNVTEDSIYTTMVNYLTVELQKAQEESNSAAEIGLWRKRLAALKANTVDYLVGGVTIADRDATKDLVEDAIKNCKSSALYGIGYAANFEGLRASYHILEKSIKDAQALSVDKDIKKAIFLSYWDIASILYGTVCNEKEIIDEYISNSLIYGEKPYDISRGMLPPIDVYGDGVLCSIKLDINILDTISKIITMMVTCNQCLLQGTSINNY